MSATRIAGVLALAGLVGLGLMMVTHSNETLTGALFYGALTCLFLAGLVMLASVAIVSIRQVGWHR